MAIKSELGNIKYPSDLIDLIPLFNVLDNIDFRLQKIEAFIENEFPYYPQLKKATADNSDFKTASPKLKRS